MNTDIFLDKGTSHFICEDYALHGKDYIIISDGCSSSKHTDVGARILSHHAESQIEIIKLIFNNKIDININEVERIFRNRVITKTLKTSNSMEIEKNFLDATLLIAFELNENILIFAYGDGIIKYKFKFENFINSIEIDYNNEPYYLSYDINYSDGKLVYKNNFNKNFYTINSTYNNILVSYLIEIGKPYVFNFQKNLLDFIVLSTDGMNTFQNKSNQINPWNDTLDFKNFTGEFLKRRMFRILKEYKKQDIDHYDDLGLGIIYNG